MQTIRQNRSTLLLLLLSHGVKYSLYIAEEAVFEWMCFETSHLDDQHWDKSAFLWGLSASSLQNSLGQGSRWGTDTNSTFSSCPLTLSVLFSDTFSPFFLLPAVQGDLSALSWKPSVRAAPCLRPTYSQQLTAQRLGGSCRKQEYQFNYGPKIQSGQRKLCVSSLTLAGFCPVLILFMFSCLSLYLVYFHLDSAGCLLWSPTLSLVYSLNLDSIQIIQKKMYFLYFDLDLKCSMLVWNVVELLCPNTSAEKGDSGHGFCAWVSVISPSHNVAVNHLLAGRRWAVNLLASSCWAEAYVSTQLWWMIYLVFWVFFKLNKC